MSRWVIFSLALIFFLPSKGSAFESLIETALRVEESIVNVRVMREDYYAGKASGARDPKSGRVLIARDIKSRHMEKGGAGVIISSQGLVVTNYHTIQYAQKIAVVLHDKTTVGAVLIHMIPERDLALLRIAPPRPLKAIAFADSNAVQLGEEVINIGNSELLRETISGGRIIGLGTTPLRSGGVSVEMIKVNMDLYKGDSGGPLLNRRGQLIGMIAARLRTQTPASLAIPSNKIKQLCLEALR